MKKQYNIDTVTMLLTINIKNVMIDDRVTK